MSTGIFMEHLPKQIPQDNHLSDKQELFRLRVYGVGIREEDKPQEGKGEDIHVSPWAQPLAWIQPQTL